MCDFGISLAIASVAIAGASAVTGYIGQQQAASAQNQQAVQVAQSANTGYRAQQQQIQAHLSQQRDALVQQDTQQVVDAERLRAQQRVSSAEAGVSGVSLDAILGQTDRQSGMLSATSERNYQTATMDARNQERNSYAQAIDRRNSVPFGQYPNLLTPILSTAGAGLNAYGQYLYKPNVASSVTPGRTQIGGGSQIGGYGDYSYDRSTTSV